MSSGEHGTAPIERQVFGKVLLEREGAVSIVTLNRPERRNALGEGLREDLWHWQRTLTMPPAPSS